MSEKSSLQYYIAKALSFLCRSNPEQEQFSGTRPPEADAMYIEKVKARSETYIRCMAPIYIFNKKDLLPDFDNCGFSLIVIKYPYTKGSFKETSSQYGDKAEILREKIKAAMQKYLETKYFRGNVQFTVIRVNSEFRYQVLANSLPKRFQMPSRNLLKYFCFQMHRYFLHDLFLMMEERLKREGDNAVLTHIGWMNYKTHAIHTAEFWRNYITNASRSDLLAIPEDCPLVLSRRNHISRGLPRLSLNAAISIPLLSYMAFSVMKPFFNYPDRKSLTMPYAKAVTALRRSLALSLTGDHAAKYARLLCGAFQEYPSGNTPEDGRRKQVSERAKRVHDGVVIYHHAQKWEKQDRDNALLQDACILTVDAVFQDDDRFLHLHIPDGTPAPESDFDMGWLSVIWAFIDKLTEKHWEFYSNKKRQAEQKALNKKHPYRVITSSSETTFIQPLVNYEKALVAISTGTRLQQRKVKQCAYLLASYEMFLRLFEANTQDELEAAYNRACAIFQEMCRDKGEREATLHLFSNYLSACFVAGEIVVVRGEIDSANVCKGWYDSKKTCLYLPYEQYYKDFSNYCADNGYTVSSKSQFQRNVLLAQDVIHEIPNGNYFRCDCPVIVAPISDLKARRINVLKIDLAALDCLYPLTQQAQQRRAELNLIRPARRRKC